MPERDKTAIKSEQDSNDTEAESTSDDDWPPKRREDNTRIGRRPGAGPKGSQKAKYDDLPDDPEALKAMYLEMQKNYKDSEARLYQESTGPHYDDETTLEEYLSQGWNRIRDVLGVFAAMIFITQIIPLELTLLAQITGAIAVASLFDTWLRPIINQHT